MQKYRDIVLDNEGNAILSATITVTDTVGGGAATLYSDRSSTQLANPFTSSAIDGAYEFYADPGRYSITVTKTGFTTESITDITISMSEQIVDTIAALKTQTPTTTGVFYRTLGYYAAGDGGQGKYRFDNASVAVADDFAVIQPTVGTGRWILQPENDIYYIKQAGVYADWNGTSGTDDTLALRKISTVIQANGGGTVDFGSNRIKIYSHNDSDLDPIFDFDDITGVNIRSAGCELTIVRDFPTPNERVEFIVGKDLINLTIGDFKCTYVGDRDNTGLGLFQRGGTFCRLSEGCINTKGGLLDIDDWSIGYYNWPGAGILQASGNRNINVEMIKAKTTGYPWLSNRGGHFATVNIETDACGRSALIQDELDLKINIKSKNFVASQDVGMSGELQNIDLNYRNTESTVAGGNVCCGLNYPVDANLVSRNIKIHSHVEVTGGLNLGYALKVGVPIGTASGDIDPAYRLYNLQLSGYIKSDTNAQLSVQIETSSAWTAGQNIDNVSIRDLTIEGALLPTMNLSALISRATLFNIVSNGRLQLITNATSKTTCYGCTVPAISANTADTSHVAMFDCNLSDNTNQSVINKAFFNTIIGATMRGKMVEGGGFTMDAAASKVIANTFTTATSKVIVYPVDAAALTLQQGANAIRKSSVSANVSFTVATFGGGNAAGTENFEYIIIN